jgi:hypothetical protein
MYLFRSKAFSISSPFYFLKAFQASLNIFKRKPEKESRYVLTMKKAKRKRNNWRVPLGGNRLCRSLLVGLA